MTTLYQFSFSHFCEKARWALDYKGKDYKVRNLLPGPHRKTTRKLARRSSVPILVDGDNTVQDSAAIIDYLDTLHPSRPLTPSNTALAAEARQWEQYLDVEIGVTLRAWFYYHTLPRTGSAKKFLLHDGPWYGRPLYGLIFPRIRRAMIAYMNINADTARDSEQRLGNAIARLAETLDGRRFLVGESFSRADLTACSLLSPVVAPTDDFKSVFPPPVCELQQQYVDHPVFAWVNAIYRDYRNASLPRQV